MARSTSRSRAAARALTSVLNPSPPPPRNRVARDERKKRFRARPDEDVVPADAPAPGSPRAHPSPTARAARSARSPTPSSTAPRTPRRAPPAAARISFPVDGLTRKNMSWRHTGATVLCTTFVRNTWSSTPATPPRSVALTYASDVPPMSAALMSVARRTRTHNRVFSPSTKKGDRQSAPLTSRSFVCSAHGRSTGSPRVSPGRARGSAATGRTICAVSRSAETYSW